MTDRVIDPRQRSWRDAHRNGLDDQVEQAPVVDPIPIPEVTEPVCGRDCACMTDCGDYYEANGLPRPAKESSDAMQAG